MPSSIDRRRVLQAMNAQFENAWLVLARCAVGLAVIALIAVIGAADLAAGGSVAAVTSPSAQPAQQHRKEVFDERRARFDGGADPRSVAGVRVRPANRLSTVLQ